MPDWCELVRQRLAGIRLDPDDAAQVIDELASHLEESYQNFRREGVAEQAAVGRALEEVDNWQQLRSAMELARKKEIDVNKRVTQFWLPAVVTLFLANTLLPVIQAFGPRWTPSPTPAGLIGWSPGAMVYVAWLVSLLFVGALGAYVSRRAGGSMRVEFMLLVFPVLPYLTFFLIGLPLHMILDERIARNVTVPALLIGLAAWVILPGSALLSGGLPMHYFASRRQS
jgi:hypothetical protein